jgi:hypothetical protein
MPGKCKVCGVYLVSSAALAQTTSRSGSGTAPIRHGLAKRRKKNHTSTESVRSSPRSANASSNKAGAQKLQTSSGAAAPIPPGPPSTLYQPACYGCAVPLAPVWLDRKRGYVTEELVLETDAGKSSGNANGNANSNKTPTGVNPDERRGGSANSTNSNVKSPQSNSPSTAASFSAGAAGSATTCTKLMPATSATIQSGLAFPYHCSACKHAFCAVCVEFAWKVLCHCPGCD